MVDLDANEVEDAVVFLTDRYLKATKTTCRVIQTPTDHCLVDICRPLIDRWFNGSVTYAQGRITLIFRQGALAPEADMLIYAPVQGDRFLYAKPRSPSNAEFSDAAESMNAVAIGDGFSAHSPLAQLLQRQHRLEEKLDCWFQNCKNVELQSISSSSPHAASQDDVASQSNSSAPYTSTFLDTALLDQKLQSLKGHITQQIRDNLAAALQPLMLGLSNLQEQLAELTRRLDELEELSLGNDDELPAPQSRNDWLERIEQTWGTVGDYERYSSTYRDANAETPLYETPDWVSLCELEWARDLCPALAQLHMLIHSPTGIGYEGADILQQFGQHLDPKTGEGYYIYRYGGFTAYETLKQLAYNPDRSWLPELKNLWINLRRADHDIFQMFGWEDDAVVALQKIATQNQSQRGYSYAQSPYGTPAAGATLKDYRAILNLGPLTPLTVEGVKRAYHDAMKAAHPDAGGSTTYAQQVNEAYEAVMRHYFPETL